LVLKLDLQDVQIIEALQQDGRMQYKDIARKVGLSLPTVRARIKRLMDLGVVRKFTIIVDPDKIYGKVRAFCLFQAHPGGIQEVCGKLEAMKEVRELYLTAGSQAIAAKVEVSSIGELGQLMTERLQEVPGVSGASCLVITTTKKEEYGAFVEPDVAIQYKCDFCDGSIVGKPHVEFIQGGRYYFTGKECAEAYKNKLKEKGKKVPVGRLLGSVAGEQT